MKATNQPVFTFLRNYFYYSLLCFRVGDTVYLSDRSAGLGMVMGAVVSRGGYMVSPALSTPSASVRGGVCKYVTEVREGVCKHVTEVRQGVCNITLVSAGPDSLLNPGSAQQFSCHSFSTKHIC